MKKAFKTGMECNDSFHIKALSSNRLIDQEEVGSLATMIPIRVSYTLPSSESRRGEKTSSGSLYLLIMPWKPIRLKP